ncbi:immunity protein 25 [Pedobacter sp. D749]|nr:immunity protein 25 [Pedobacter sp. D749]
MINMKSGFHDVVNDFEILIKEYEFKLPKKLWYDNIVVLSKHIESIFYCFIIARVNKLDGSLQKDLWVGPLNRPDDGLENLSANIKVKIGYTQVLEEDFFKNCESKIINLISGQRLTYLVNSSKKELEKPSFNNYRYTVFTAFILPFCKIVISAAKEEKKLNSKKEVGLIIEKIFPELTGEMSDFFNKLGVKGTKEKIWELCYIYSL